MSAEESAGRMKLPFLLKPGAVVVLEGLDATGKTTQHEKMERACMGMGHGTTPLFSPAPLFLHMPSAGTHLGEMIYDLTETVGKELDPLARQFLHLASHSQSTEQAIRPALADGRGVILDRWWWSTVACGWFGGELADRIPLGRFMDMCKAVWRGVEPDLVALFMHPHQDDHHNTDEVVEGYEYMASLHRDKVALIEPGDEGQQGEQLFAEMARRDIYRSA